MKPEIDWSPGSLVVCKVNIGLKHSSDLEPNAELGDAPMVTVERFIAGLVVGNGQNHFNNINRRIVHIVPENSLLWYMGAGRIFWYGTLYTISSGVWPYISLAAAYEEAGG